MVSARFSFWWSIRRVALIGLVQAFFVGWILHRLHSDPSESHEIAFIDPRLHWLRDAALATPLAILFLLTATYLTERALWRRSIDFNTARVRVAWAAAGALAYALASFPGSIIHSWLFLAGHTDSAFLAHLLGEAVVTLRYSFALLLLVAIVSGVPLRGPDKEFVSSARPVSHYA